MLAIGILAGTVLGFLLALVVTAIGEIRRMPWQEDMERDPPREE